MSKEHLMKHCVDSQALLTDKQTGRADIDGLQMNRRTGCVVCFSENKRPTIRSTAVHN
jgi:hypothetical protein